MVGARSPGFRAFPPRLPEPRLRLSGCASSALRRTSPVTVAGARRVVPRLPSPPAVFAGHGSVEATMTVNLTRIYTRLGDGGETHLGDMSRVPKTHPRIEAYGAIDELNAQVGVALATDGLPKQYTEWLSRIQNDLFDCGADLSV